VAPVTAGGSQRSGLHPVPGYGLTVGGMDETTVPVLVPVEIEALAGCALPTVERPLRLSEFDRLFATAVRAVRRPDRRRLRLALDPEPAVAARTADLVVRETRCCSFFTFTLTTTGGAVSLDMAVPDRHVDLLDVLADRAARRGAV
jgi:hypothetical protein